MHLTLDHMHVHYPKIKDTKVEHHHEVSIHVNTEVFHCQLNKPKWQNCDYSNYGLHTRYLLGKI